MKLDAVPILAIFALAVLCVMVSIEGSYRLGRIVHQRSKQKSKRTLVMPLLAVAFASVITIIGSLDRPVGGFTTVSQQPLTDLLSSIEAPSR
jgi:hypothetical protein